MPQGQVFLSFNRLFAGAEHEAQGRQLQMTAHFIATLPSTFRKSDQTKGNSNVPSATDRDRGRAH
jgi:hypothetical protein